MMWKLFLFLCVARIIFLFVVCKFSFTHNVEQGRRLLQSQERFDKYYRKRGFELSTPKDNNADLFIEVLKKKTIHDEKAKAELEKEEKNTKLLCALALIDMIISPSTVFLFLGGGYSFKSFFCIIAYVAISFLLWKGWAVLFEKLHIQSHFFFEEHRYNEISLAAEEDSLKLMEQDDDELYLSSFGLIEIANQIKRNALKQTRNVYLFITAFWAIIIFASL